MHATSSVGTNFRGKCPLSEPPIRELSGLSVGPANVWHSQKAMPTVINLDKPRVRRRDVGGGEETKTAPRLSRGVGARPRASTHQTCLETLRWAVSYQPAALALGCHLPWRSVLLEPQVHPRVPGFARSPMLTRWTCRACPVSAGGRWEHLRPPQAAVTGLFHPPHW